MFRFARRFGNLTQLRRLVFGIFDQRTHRSGQGSYEREPSGCPVRVEAVLLRGYYFRRYAAPPRNNELLRFLRESSGMSLPQAR